MGRRLEHCARPPRRGRRRPLPHRARTRCRWHGDGVPGAGAAKLTLLGALWQFTVRGSSELAEKRTASCQTHAARRTLAVHRTRIVRTRRKTYGQLPIATSPVRFGSWPAGGSGVGAGQPVRRAGQAWALASPCGGRVRRGRWPARAAGEAGVGAGQPARRARRAWALASPCGGRGGRPRGGVPSLSRLELPAGRRGRSGGSRYRGRTKCCHDNPVDINVKGLSRWSP
jgi:hypothetical protein